MKNIITYLVFLIPIYSFGITDTLWLPNSPNFEYSLIGESNENHTKIGTWTFYEIDGESWQEYGKAYFEFDSIKNSSRVTKITHDFADLPYDEDSSKQFITLSNDTLFIFNKGFLIQDWGPHNIYKTFLVKEDYDLINVFENTNYWNYTDSLKENGVTLIDSFSITSIPFEIMNEAEEDSIFIDEVPSSLNDTIIPNQIQLAGWDITQDSIYDVNINELVSDSIYLIHPTEEQLENCEYEDQPFSFLIFKRRNSFVYLEIANTPHYFWEVNYSDQKGFIELTGMYSYGMSGSSHGQTQKILIDEQSLETVFNTTISYSNTHMNFMATEEENAFESHYETLHFDLKNQTLKLSYSNKPESHQPKKWKTYQFDKAIRRFVLKP